MNRDLPRPQPEEPNVQHGQATLALLGLMIGILLMGIQLWLLTLAFDLYLEGKRSETLIAAIISGLVFLGGLLMLRYLHRSPWRRG
jgi:hypothetical protein